MTIQGEAASPLPPWSMPAPNTQVRPEGPPFVTSVSPGCARGWFRRHRHTAISAEAALTPAKIDRFRVQSNAPSGAVTAVRPDHRGLAHLSQMSVKRVTATPVPDGGIEPGADTASLACSTLESSMSIPGNCTVGGLVVWKVCARFPNVGSTCGVSSAR